MKSLITAKEDGTWSAFISEFNKDGIGTILSHHQSIKDATDFVNKMMDNEESRVDYAEEMQQAERILGDTYFA